MSFFFTQDTILQVKSCCEMVLRKTMNCLSVKALALNVHSAESLAAPKALAAHKVKALIKLQKKLVLV